MQKVFQSLHSSSLCNTFSRTLSINRLRQILHVAPEFFEVAYAVKVKSDGSKSHELAFKKPEVVMDNFSTQQQKCDEFKRRLMLIAEKFHDELLTSLNLQSAKFKTSWHPKFSGSNVPPIPFSELPEAPKESKKTALQTVQEKYVTFNKFLHFFLKLF